MVLIVMYCTPLQNYVDFFSTHILWVTRKKKINEKKYDSCLIKKESACFLSYEHI